VSFADVADYVDVVNRSAGRAHRVGNPAATFATIAFAPYSAQLRHSLPYPGRELNGITTLPYVLFTGRSWRLIVFAGESDRRGRELKY
jgi:hypothetical protein